MMRLRLYLLFSLSVVHTLSDGAASYAASDTSSKSAEIEQGDRKVDQSALNAKKRGVNSLYALWKRRKNTSEEPSILLRLSEALQDLARFEFRIAYGNSKKKVDLTTYNTTLKRSLDPLNRLISTYPSDPGIKRGYYLRAKAYKEIGQKDKAVLDLKYLIENYPGATDTNLANVTMWDLLLEQKEYKSVIQYVNRADIKPNSPYYGLAMDRLSWAYYYLNEIKSAIYYVEQQILYYKNQKATLKTAQLEQDKAVVNLVLFYGAAIETKVPGASGDRALEYFKGFTNDDLVGKSLVQLSVLLRTKGLDEPLEAVFRSVSQSQLNDLYKHDLYLILFEHFINRRRWPSVKQTVDMSLSLIYSNKAIRTDLKRFNKAIKVFSDAASILQPFVIELKERPEVAPVAATLKSIYEFSLRGTKPDRATQIKIHYNLAEILFPLKDYDNATLHYRWIVKNGTLKNPDEAKLVIDAGTKSILARYEQLKQKEIMPKDLKAVALNSISKRPLDDVFKEWMEWIDVFPAENKIKSGVDFFDFESARALYVHGEMDMAFARLENIAKKFPKSEYAVPAVVLTLDTYIATQDWRKVYDTAILFGKLNHWREAEFNRKLSEIASDSYYKMIEQAYKAKEYANALKAAEAFLKAYPSSKLRNNCLEVAANSALALNDKKTALRYFEDLKKSGVRKPEVVGTTILMSATVAEEDVDFQSAAAQYRNYLVTMPANVGVDKDEREKIRKKALLLSWLSGSINTLNETLQQTKICPNQDEPVCAEYMARISLQKMEGPFGPKNQIFLFKKARSGANGHDKIIHATIALKSTDNYEFARRNEMLNVVAKEWDATDPLLKIALYPYLADLIPKTLQTARQQIKFLGKVKMDKASIENRVRLVAELEKQAEKLLAFPWARLKVTSINEIANLYHDLSRDLASIKTPAGLDAAGEKVFTDALNEIRAPFDQKRDSLRKQAFDSASEAGVEQNTMDAVIQGMDSDSGTKHYRVPLIRSPNSRYSLELLDGLIQFTQPKQKAFRQQLAVCVQQKNWPKVSFLVGQASESKLFTDPILDVLRGITFYGIGAQAEAQTEILKAFDTVESNQRVRLAVPLVENFYAAQNKERVKVASEVIHTDRARLKKSAWITHEDTQLLVYAARWSGSDYAPDLSTEFSIALPTVSAGEKVPQ